MRIPKSKTLYVSAAALSLLGVTAAANGSAYKTVTVQDNGQRKVIRGLSKMTLGRFLESMGISVSSRDRVFPSLSSPLQDGMMVSIQSPNEIELVDGGVAQEVDTFANTVGELLREEAIDLHPGDQLTESTSSRLHDGQIVVVHRKKAIVSTKTQDIPFQTIRQRTDRLFEGQQRVLTYGVKGLLETRTVNTYIDGHKVGETVTKRVSRKPVTQVVEIGTSPRMTELSRPSRWPSSVLSSRSDAMGMIVRRITVVATAYVSGGRTATGCAARPGIIAVDPSVIPLGTKLYIPGMGVVYAEDTGGAIVGNRIDICMNSEAEAMRWGVRTITLYVVR